MIVNSPYFIIIFFPTSVQASMRKLEIFDTTVALVV